MALHVTALAAVVAFGLLARWQVHRALSGNSLSWAYVFEWPFFALAVVYMWWKLLHDDDEPRRALRPEDPAVEEQRAAYNRYLQSLAEGSGSRS